MAGQWSRIVGQMTSQFSSPYCQTQLKLQVKLNLKAELALFSFPPAAHPPVQNSSDVSSNLYASIVGPKLEDDLNFRQMEDDLNLLANGR